MPVVEVTLAKGVFSTEQQHQMARKITDAIAEVQGSEAFREYVVVMINDLQEGYYIGGETVDPAKLEKALQSKAAM